MAVNCCVAPSAIDGLCGLMEIEVNAAGVTVKVADPLTEAELMVMVVVPVPSVVASPIEPVASLIVATFGALEVQLPLCVTSWVVPSLNVPTAVNCWVVPKATVGVDGFTAIETSTAGVTVRVPDPVIEPEVAVIVTLP